MYSIYSFCATAYLLSRTRQARKQNSFMLEGREKNDAEVQNRIHTCLYFLFSG
jgi:septin family protein